MLTNRRAPVTWEFNHDSVSMPQAAVRRPSNTPLNNFVRNIAPIVDPDSRAQDDAGT
jgi:hypothetical protein